MFKFIRRSSIRKAVAIVGPELLKRYGNSTDCSLEQLRRTAAELGYEGTVLHYLCCCCLSEGELKKAKRQSFLIAWSDVEKESEEMLRASRSFGWSNSFHESHTGHGGA